MRKVVLGVKGSASSGNRMHAGRPGKVGGSAPRNFGPGAAAYIVSSQNVAAGTYLSNVLATLDINTLNRAGMQALIDHSQGFVTDQDLLDLLSDPRSLKGSPVKSYMTSQWLLQNQPGYALTPPASSPQNIPPPVFQTTPVPQMNLKPTVVPNDYEPWDDLKAAGLIIPDKNMPGSDYVPAANRWIYTVDAVDPYGKTSIANYQAGNITAEALHRQMAPAYRDIKDGYLDVKPGDDPLTAQGKVDFSSMYQDTIEGNRTRAELRQRRDDGGMWVSQVGVASMTPNQWEKVSQFKKGYITEEELKQAIAPHTIKAPKVIPTPTVPTKPVSSSSTTHAPYTTIKQLPSLKAIANSDGQARDAKGKPVSGDGTLQMIVKDQGFDGLPHIITQAEFNAYKKAGETVIYRGTSSGKSDAHRTARYKEFREGEFFQGYGMHGNGTYVSTDKKTAHQYAGGSGNKIMAMTIKVDAKIIDQSYLQKLMNKQQQTSGNPVPSSITSDAGRFAAALGYDAIKIPNQSYSGNMEDFFVILNRTALRVLDMDLK